MIEHKYYPKDEEMTVHLDSVIEVFRKTQFGAKDKSKEILKKVGKELEKLNYTVETSGSAVKVPFSSEVSNSKGDFFKVDAYNAKMKTVIEIEAGRAVMNNQFLRVLMQATLMQDVDFLVIAVKRAYLIANRENKDFDSVCTFMDALYSSDRVVLPLKGILIIGY